MKSNLHLAALALSIATTSPCAFAWGDTGHEVVALVARANMNPKARAEADRLLAGDSSSFAMTGGGRTSDSFDRQATWADYYRDQQRSGAGNIPERIHTYFWHFVDIELHGGNLGAACYGFPSAAGLPASEGPDPDCVVDKIEQFTAELGSSTVPDTERVLALRFLMHFVGDLHQPLHASDDFDRGGNNKKAVIAPGAPMALHHHWDTTFVEMLAGTTGGAPTASAVLARLRTPSVLEKQQWSVAPNPRNWAYESYALAASYAYNLPAPDPTQVYTLDATYVKKATGTVEDQLLKAGFRLARILNDTLGR